MKNTLLSFIIAFWFGLFVYHSSSANENNQAKGSHGQRHWVAPPEAAKRINPIESDVPSINRGKRLFLKHCVVCHGPQGRGDGPAAVGLDPKPSNLVDNGDQHPEGDIAWKIASGRGPMPAWKGTLSEKNIWDLTNFIKSLAGKPNSQ